MSDIIIVAPVLVIVSFFIDKDIFEYLSCIFFSSVVDFILNFNKKTAFQAFLRFIVKRIIAASAQNIHIP